jgi:hypothetical protein
MDTAQYKKQTFDKGYADGKGGKPRQNASDKFGPHSGEYEKGYDSGRRDRGQVTESVSVRFTPAELQQLRDEDISDSLIDKLIEWVNEYDPRWMPYGTQKARDGDPYNWVMDRIEEISEIILNKRHVKEELINEDITLPPEAMEELDQFVKYGMEVADEIESSGEDALGFGRARVLAVKRLRDRKNKRKLTNDEMKDFKKIRGIMVSAIGLEDMFMSRVLY